MECTALKGRGANPLKPRPARVRSRGLTLIEAAMVLAILALVVAGIMQFYSQANMSRQTTAALGELASVQQNIRSLYDGQASYAGMTTALIAKSKALPAKMVNGVTLRHSFNGAIDIAAANAGGGWNSGFQVEFENVPQKACIKMLSYDYGRGLYAMGVGSASRTQTDGLPYTLAAATAACSAANDDVVWIFS